MSETADVKKVVEDTKKKMAKGLDATKKEFQNIRTGRASTALLDSVTVDYYNTPTPLKGVANISTPDARTISIQPWDPTIIGEIERGILKSGLGLMPVNDGKVVRIQMPALTDERREELTKLVRKVAEEGRVSIRNARHEGIEIVKKSEKAKLVPEDISHNTQKEIQKVTDASIAQLDEALKQKEAEIHAV